MLLWLAQEYPPALYCPPPLGSLKTLELALARWRSIFPIAESDSRGTGMLRRCEASTLSAPPPSGVPIASIRVLHQMLLSMAFSPKRVQLLLPGQTEVKFASTNMGGSRFASAQGSPWLTRGTKAAGKCRSEKSGSIYQNRGGLLFCGLRAFVRTADNSGIRLSAVVPLGLVFAATLTRLANPDGMIWGTIAPSRVICPQIVSNGTSIFGEYPAAQIKNPSQRCLSNT